MLCPQYVDLKGMIDIAFSHHAKKLSDVRLFFCVDLLLRGRSLA